MAELSVKSRAWALFDQVVRDQGEPANPWRVDATGVQTYEPDFDTLTRLLGVPLLLDASTQTGVPALALDVWLSYEFRRAGFTKDAVWPRAESPRVLPQAVVRLLAGLNQSERGLILGRLAGGVTGVTSDSANILGKNYFKQVDVLMSDWDTGPEILISTKRMDSSFGKNAANRVEESYGDAKNLRLRHPMASLGFVYGLRSTILETEPVKFEWLADLLVKLGREEDAYHAVALVMIDYDNAAASGATADDDVEDDANIAAGLAAAPLPVVPLDLEESDAHAALNSLPRVTLLHDSVPEELQPARFLATIIHRVLAATPVNRHEEARRRRKNPQKLPS